MKKLLFAGVAICALSTTSNAASGDGVGAFYGGGTPDPFQTWLGNTLTVTGDFLNANGWSAFETLVGSSPLSTWVSWENALPGRRLVTYGIPAFAWGVSANYTACASGTYNTHWKNLANNVVNSGIQHLDLRISWEFDGSWTGEYYPNGDYTHFVGCWQQIVNTVRSVDTNHVMTFDWNPTAACCSYLDERYWPGDQYVDYVGMDLYNTQSSSATSTSLNEIAAFAKKHGKKITFPEWGAWPIGNNGGQGDDPAYIQAMYNFMSNASNNVAWSNYFDISGDADHRLDPPTNFPSSSATYRQLFTAPYAQPVSMWAGTQTAQTPSPSGTTIPSASQIVDPSGNVWTVSGGLSYINGVHDTGADINLLLTYNGVIYANTNSHGWFSHASGVWQSIPGDPRTSMNTSPSGTTIPKASSIIDSMGNIWTVSGGLSYINGQHDTGADISLLLYYNGVVYANTNSHGWFSHASGAWQSIAGDPRVSASPSGTTIPSASQIIDGAGNVWTVSNGLSYINGVHDTGADISLLLYYNGVIYADTNSNGWFTHASGVWQVASGDPRNAPAASPSGTTIPSATQITDSGGNVWTVSNGLSYINGVHDTGQDISLLLYYQGVIYANTNSHGWFTHASGAWQVAPGDPRI